ncbi:MAG: hypothetical protein JJT82_09580 [Legionellaceae bacterium]|nr:hypothetical protein [Legionellaceae bacterium]
MNNVSYQVYSLNNFNDLCGAVQTNQYAEKTRFRFLVDQTGKLWFAPEGIANNIIPAHYQITGQDRTYAKCYAAGTISVEDGVLTSIDNKSGDFTPAFENLFYLLAILANTDSLPFKISENLKIEENRGDHRTLVISSNDLMSWGKQYAHTITEQPQENITRVYGVQPGNDADKDVLRQYCPSPAKKRCHNEITRPSSVDRSLFFPPSDNKASSSHENEPNDNLAKVLF